MNTLLDLLASLPQHGDRLLLWSPAESLSYADAYTNAIGLAGYLRSLGLGAGDEVLITLHNGSAFPAVLLGVAAAGCTAILADREASGQLMTVGIKSPPVAHIHDYNGAAQIELRGAVETSLLLSHIPGSKVGTGGALPVREPEDIAVVLYTSGSGGVGRGVVKTHANLMVEVADLADILARPGDRFLSVLPWSYIYGLLHHLILPMYVAGTTCYLHSYTPADLLNTLINQDIGLFIGVPVLYRILSTLPAPLPRNSLSWAVSSGAALDAATATRISERLGWQLVEFYGSTESGGISFNPDKLGHGYSVGYPMPHIQVRELPTTDETGVLQVRGPTVSDWAYEATSRVSLIDADGWYSTNDTGYIDGNGRLRLLGRVSRLIKVAGRRVSLDSIEAALLTIPGVMDAIVSARSDRVHGEVAVADVVPAPGSSLSLDSLMRDCQQRLPSYQRPRRINLCDRIDRRRINKAPVAVESVAESSEQE